ncbi:hypothetical protein BFJ68_g17772 [Fusarium oxysporum]|uniref:NmrA-like domain-containing protein n=2 Tax=Fusarium oxysporum TaxID=5507 RepID=A0A420NI66_FUSOX|nr:hypothetical protein BFJ65_g17011 [Fusarium oxysporum f. sp. cepae]RKK21117.1 hypothetical protein BFJ67_g17454 [Fusarium oxysporum f. sp. cepae]RKK79939.1 hypothetical protein BFJ68_g17772 [Fusarium oxysporum]
MPALAKKTSYIYMAAYATNGFLYPKKDAETGEYVLTVPTSKNLRMPIIDIDGSAGSFVRALIEDEPAGTKLLAYDSDLNILEIVDTWSRVTGKKAVFQSMSEEEMHKKTGLPYEVLDGAAYLDEYGYVEGVEGAITPEQLKKPVKTDSFEEYLRKQDMETLLSFHDAFNQGLFKSVRSSQHALASLYGGNGAKIIRLSAQTGQSPPPYREITPPPPSAPIYNKKRSRQDSQNERDNDIAQIWAVLAKIKERDTRNEALENENRCLRKEIEELRERVAVLEKQKDDNEHVEAQTNDNTMALVDVDVELADMREDIRELKAKADSVERGELAEMVKHDVLEYMRVRLFDD